MSDAAQRVTLRRRLGAWVALGRPSNLPTLWADALVGVILGIEALRHARQLSPTFPTGWRGVVDFIGAGGWLLWMGLSLVYMGGMALNDWTDAERDRELKADRPIPTGLIGREAAGAAAVVMLAAGVICLSMLSAQAQWLAWALAAAVVVYDLLHKRWYGSVIIMGMCRGLAILAGAAALAAPMRSVLYVGLPLAAIATAYVALLSVVARSEAENVGADPDAKPTRTRWALIAFPLLAVLWVAPNGATLLAWAAVFGGLLVVWLLLSQRHLTARPPRIGSAVAWYIAGIAMVDAWFLALLGRPILAGVAVLLAVATLGAQRLVKGT